VLETVHDPELVAEVNKAYPAGITVTFALITRSQSCLDALNAAVAGQWKAAAGAGITVDSSGLGRSQVEVGVSACTPTAERVARRWFARRWGVAVSIDTCQKPAVAAVGRTG
jgi:hypothetical protein